MSEVAVNDPRWTAVAARDTKADGTFYYSVSTTGVYCFPSCPSRLAKRENVSFHRTRADAERAGFRPCKRCKPDRDGMRHRRATAEIRFAIRSCSLCLVLVAQRAISERGICAVLLGDDDNALRSELQIRFPDAALIESDPKLDAIVARVVQFMEYPARGLDVALDVHGTEFQQQVWRALREIPVGETASYTEIASRIGRPASVRAVAHACAANALAVVIPCHRAVRSDGGLAGYRWGIERKRTLLEREAAA